MTALDGLFVAALLCAMWAAVRGRSIAAWPMIVGTGVTSLLCWRGLAFDPAVWMLIDFAVISAIVALAIMRLELTARDVVVIILFAPAWYLYRRNDWWAVDGNEALVIAQFLVTVRWRGLAADGRSLARRARKAVRHEADRRAAAHA